MTEPATAQPDGRTETILIAEDHGGIRTLARRMLEKWGYRVLDAAHGRDALDMARAYQGLIDLLLTDLTMPDMGGAELARKLALHRPETRLLVISAFADEPGVADTLSLPGAVFLSKPFTLQALAAKVREALDAPGPAR